MPKNNDQYDRKFFAFEAKEVDVPRSEFVGFAAAIGNRDLGNDIIEPGAFDKTISERVAAGKVKLLDNHDSWSTRSVWGTMVDAREVEVDGFPDPPEGPSHKLEARFKVSESDPDAQVALRKVEEGHLDALSIGFKPLKVEFEMDDDAAEESGVSPRTAWAMGNGVRRIKEIQLWETSLVIWGMNPEAVIVTDSVGRLEEFARKAAAQGIDVPEENVRRTIEALSQLTAERCAAADAGMDEEVRAAVCGVSDALKRLDGRLRSDPRDHLRSLMEEYREEYGADEVDPAGFQIWVGDGLTDADASTDGTGTREEPAPGEDSFGTDLNQIVEIKGETGGNLISENIRDRAEETDQDLEDVREEAGEAAGISASTVLQIERAEIECPPMDRLEGFASLDWMPSQETIVSAFEEDGCDYSEQDEDAAVPDLETDGCGCGEKEETDAGPEERGGVEQEAVRGLIEAANRLADALDAGASAEPEGERESPEETEESHDDGEGAARDTEDGRAEHSQEQEALAKEIEAVRAMGAIYSLDDAA